jgi:hypothetical protein
METGDGTGQEEKPEIRDLLKRLHEELGRTQTVDKETLELLEALKHETEALLDRPADGPPAEYESLSRGLKASLERFEGSHPTLAWVMGRVIDTLSGLGI